MAPAQILNTLMTVAAASSGQAASSSTVAHPTVKRKGPAPTAVPQDEAPAAPTDGSTKKRQRKMQSAEVTKKRINKEWDKIGVTADQVAKIMEARTWIYVVVDRLDNDKVVYVGQTEDRRRRWQEHERVSSKCKLLRKWMEERTPDSWDFRIVGQLPEGCAPQHANLMEAYFIAHYRTFNNMLFNDDGCNGTAGNNVAEHDPKEAERLLKDGYEFPDTIHIEPISEENMRDSFAVSAAQNLTHVTTITPGQPPPSSLVDVCNDLRVRVVEPAARTSFYDQLVLMRDRYAKTPTHSRFGAAEVCAELTALEKNCPASIRKDYLDVDFRHYKAALHPDKKPPSVVAPAAYHIYGHLVERVGQWLEDHMDVHNNETLQFFVQLREWSAHNPGRAPSMKHPAHEEERDLANGLSRWKNFDLRPWLNKVRFLFRHFDAAHPIMKTYIASTLLAVDATAQLVGNLRKLLTTGWYFSSVDGRSSSRQYLTRTCVHSAEWSILVRHLTNGEHPTIGAVLYGAPKGTMTQERCDAFAARHAKALLANAPKREEYNRQRRVGGNSVSFQAQRQARLPFLRELHARDEIPAWIDNAQKRKAERARWLGSHGNGVGPRSRTPWVIFRTKCDMHFVSVGKKADKAVIIGPIDPDHVDDAMKPGTVYDFDRAKQLPSYNRVLARRDAIERARALLKAGAIPEFISAIGNRRRKHKEITKPPNNQAPLHGVPGYGAHAKEPWMLMQSEDGQSIFIVSSEHLCLTTLCSIEPDDAEVAAIAAEDAAFEKIKEQQVEKRRRANERRRSRKRRTNASSSSGSNAAPAVPKPEREEECEEESEEESECESEEECEEESEEEREGESECEGEEDVPSADPLPGGDDSDFSGC